MEGWRTTTMWKRTTEQQKSYSERRDLRPRGDLLALASLDTLFHTERHKYNGETFSMFLRGLSRRTWSALRRQAVALGLAVSQCDRPICICQGRLPAQTKRNANTACSMQRLTSKDCRVALAKRKSWGVSLERGRFEMSLATRR